MQFFLKHFYARKRRFYFLSVTFFNTVFAMISVRNKEEKNRTKTRKENIF